jgi:hypothetical protein
MNYTPGSSSQVQRVNTNFTPQATDVQRANTNYVPSSSKVQTVDPNFRSALTVIQPADLGAGPTVTNIKMVNGAYTPALGAAQQANLNTGAAVQTVNTNYVPNELKNIRYFIELNPANIFAKDVLDKNYRLAVEFQSWVLITTVTGLVSIDVFEYVLADGDLKDSYKFVRRVLDAYGNVTQGYTEIKPLYNNIVKDK